MNRVMKYLPAVMVVFGLGVLAGHFNPLRKPYEGTDHLVQESPHYIDKIVLREPLANDDGRVKEFRVVDVQDTNNSYPPTPETVRNYWWFTLSGYGRPVTVLAEPL